MVTKMKREQSIGNDNKKNRSNRNKVIIFVVSISLVLGAYLLSSVLIKRVKEKEYIVGTHNDLLRYIESVEVTGKELVISGWCFYTGADTEQNKVQVFLRNVEDETDTIWLDVDSVLRDDVDEYYDCNVDYRHCGFRASKELKKISLEGKNYEILVKLTYYADKAAKNDGEEAVKQEKYVKTVLTNRYLCDGVFTALLPEDELVRTESALLNEIIEKGQLMLYQKEADMYVYQYGTRMYWVAGKDFFFEEDGTTYIQFQLGTTRADRLPEYRQENGWNWDNIGFVFEERELKDEATELYRITVRDIPIEYPITHFWTGYYTNSAWVWRVYRTPDIFELGK